MKKVTLAAFMLLAVFACEAATLAGRVVAVSDGDTVTVLTAENRRFKVRLSGIDAPEKKQAFGAQSTQTLTHHLIDHLVTVEWSKTDRYGRIVGRIELDGVDANLEQIRAGSAWVYLQYLRELPFQDRGRYLDAQQQAQDERRGLWSDMQPAPPWQWRRERRPEKRG